MLKSILIGIDGSDFGRAAVDLGTQWARHYGASLIGMGVVDEPTICGAEAVPLGGAAFKGGRDEARLADARQKVEDALGSFASRCTSAGVSYEMLESTGLPAEQIMLESQRHDLIVLGQQTFFHFETQRGADETLRTVVRHSPRPVVAVPRPLREGTKVLVAYDGSVQAARTLQAFERLGLSAGREIHLVSVHQNATDAAHHIDRAADYFRRHGVSAQAHPIATVGQPAAAILERLEALGAGLLVMGAYGQPTIKELFLGSVTRQILDNCDVPVFLYH
ncbi:MAG: universal stress protein [Planctomycetaceae bacterium]